MAMTVYQLHFITNFNFCKSLYVGLSQKHYQICALGPFSDKTFRWPKIRCIPNFLQIEKTEKFSVHLERHKQGLVLTHAIGCTWVPGAHHGWHAAWWGAARWGPGHHTPLDGPWSHWSCGTQRSDANSERRSPSPLMYCLLASLSSTTINLPLYDLS